MSKSSLDRDLLSNSSKNNTDRMKVDRVESQEFKSIELLERVQTDQKELIQRMSQIADVNFKT